MIFTVKEIAVVAVPGTLFALSEEPSWEPALLLKAMSPRVFKRTYMYVGTGSVQDTFDGALMVNVVFLECTSGGGSKLCWISESSSLKFVNVVPNDMCV